MVPIPYGALQDTGHGHRGGKPSTPPADAARGRPRPVCVPGERHAVSEKGPYVTYDLFGFLDKVRPAFERAAGVELKECARCAQVTTDTL